MSEKKLFLLDALALIYRAHFAFIRNPRINSKGINTSAVFGFTNSLLEILNKHRPSHLAVAFDTSAPTFRHIEYPEYKAQREAMPEDLRVAIPLVKKLLESLNIPILEQDGFEADDIIGTIAHKAEGHGFDVYMVTPDKDYCQLITDKVFMYKPARSGNGAEVLTAEKVFESYGVTPAQFPDYLGLMGDASDNIPGVPKVGPKTATKLLQEHGDMDTIFTNAPNIKGAVGKRLVEFADQGRLSKHLATILRDAPIDYDEGDCKVGEPKREEFFALMNELEFRATVDRIMKSTIFDGARQTDLFGNAVPETPLMAEEKFDPDAHLQTLETREHNYVLVETQEARAKLIKDIQEAGSFCFDTETTGLDPMTHKMIAITISIKPHEAYMIHFPPKDPNLPAILEEFRPVFESTEILKIGQNLKFDMLLLKNYGITVSMPIYDTMLAHYVIDPDQKHGMDAMAKTLLNYNPVSITSLIGKKGKGQLSMDSVPLEKLLPYACEDADITLELMEKLAPQVEERGGKKALDTVELPLIPVLTDMEFNGIKINEEALALYSEELGEELAKTEKEIYDQAGVKFNINSPKQMGEILFVRLEIPESYTKKTRTGQFSTNEATLTKIAESEELPDAQREVPLKVLHFRQLAKLKSTYVDALPQLVNPKTSRIHTTYAQAVTATGRLSSNNPNIQNIPIRREEGRMIRKAFIPEEGFVLLAVDYSQVELRLMAEFSQDEGMLEAFIEGQDIHRATAAKVFEVTPEEVDSDMRAKAKMVNFGIIYGISAFGLSQRLKISRKDAKEIIDSYFSKYPGVKNYMDKCIADARDNGYAETLLGRRRYLPDITSANHTVRSFAERTAINTPVQGSAADLIKVAMINIWNAMQEKGMKSRMLLQVHDELVFEAHLDEVETLTEMVTDLMENAIPMSVPMKVEAGVGENWLIAH